MGDWNYPKFVLHLLAPIALFLMAALAFPDFDKDESYDLRKYFLENRGWFFTFSAASLTLTMFNVYIFRIEDRLSSLDIAFRIFGIVQWPVPRFFLI